MHTYETPSVDLASREYQENAAYGWTRYGHRLVLLTQCAVDTYRFNTTGWWFGFDLYAFSFLGGFGKGVCMISTRQ